MAYSTVATVRGYARDLDPGKVDIDTIETFIAAADSQIDELAGHDYLDTSDQVDYYDGNDFDRLILDHRPVLAITEIAKRTSTPSWEVLTEFDPSTGEGDYILDKPLAGLVRWTSSERPTEGTFAIRVTYDYGYSSPPGYVEALSAILAAINTLITASGSSNPDGLASISEGALSLSFGSGSSGPYQDSIANLTQQANALIEKILKRRVTYVPSRK